MLKTAVLTPMPSASTSTATAVNNGLRRSVRMAHFIGVGPILRSEMTAGDDSYYANCVEGKAISIRPYWLRFKPAATPSDGRTSRGLIVAHAGGAAAAPASPFPSQAF